MGYGIAVDAAGSAYVTGCTYSSGFPTTPDAFDASYNGGYDAFLVKLNPTGSALAYATFLGGADNDWGYSIAVDAAGSAYVTGEADSSDFPTTPGAFDTSYNGDDDGFVVKLNPTGSALAYGTFLGGSDIDRGYGIAVDAAGSACVIGGTASSDFPTTPGAFDTSYNSGPYDHDAFVVKLNPTGSALAYATFLGGSSFDLGWDIAVDAAGSAYVTGGTDSSDFPTTPGAFDTSYNNGDAFVVKLNPTGSALAYATFLGGSGEEWGHGGIAVDAAGSAYVTGITQSTDFPTTPGAIDASYNGGGGDAFVAKLNPTGSALTYATFLGGSGEDWGSSIAVDAAGSTYVIGVTRSSDFPTTPGAFDTSYNDGYYDAFVVKLGLAKATINASAPGRGRSSTATWPNGRRWTRRCSTRTLRPPSPAPSAIPPWPTSPPACAPPGRPTHSTSPQPSPTTSWSATTAPTPGTTMSSSSASASAAPRTSSPSLSTAARPTWANPSRA